MLFLEVDPSTVKPGWTPLIITVLLAAAIALLMISMRRQIRKISVPHRDEVVDSEADGSEVDGSEVDGSELNGSELEGSGSSGSGAPGHDRSDGTAESTEDSEPGGTALDGIAGRRHPIGHG